jgi:hypothetical protein
MLARRRVAAHRAARGASRVDAEAEVIWAGLLAEDVWAGYCSECVARSCQPIRALRSQLGKQRLTLSRYAVTDVGLVALGGLLRNIARADRLRSLALIDVGMRGTGIAVLMAALGGAKSLTALVLDHNPLSSQRGLGGGGGRCRGSSKDFQDVVSVASEGINAVALFVETSRSLRLLSLEKTRLGSGDIIRLANAAGRATGLRAIAMGDNPQDLRVHALAPATALAGLLHQRVSSGRSALLSLEYGGNPLGHDAAVRLAEGFIGSGGLRRVCLAKTGACSGAAACKAIAKWLEDPGCAVDRLDLCRCGMNEAGALVLADAVNCCSRCGSWSFVAIN